jgi:hypothetical protein
MSPWDLLYITVDPAAVDDDDGGGGGDGWYCIKLCVIWMRAGGRLE